MAKKAEKAKTVFMNATDILQKETNNGTSCDSAKEALTLLKNCSNSSAEACDSGELGITKDEIKNCLTKMQNFKDIIQVSAKGCLSKNNKIIADKAKKITLSFILNIPINDENYE